jgi:hypothetical protein
MLTFNSTSDKQVMSTLKFSDGMEFNTSGPIRKELRADGWYVVGEGKLIPVKDEEEADTEIRVHKIQSAKNPRAEFFNQIGDILKG